MPFDAYQAALELIRLLRPLVEQIKRHDPDLATQLKDAASSVALCLREGSRRVGRDRPHLHRVSSGSAGEVMACLEVAEAWGYVGAEDIAPAAHTCDRVLAMTWRLTH